MNDIYKNIEEYDPNKKREILIVFDDMITDMLSNTNLNQVVTRHSQIFNGKEWNCII